jgi:hypothetical protein
MLNLKPHLHYLNLRELFFAFACETQEKEELFISFYVIRLDHKQSKMIHMQVELCSSLAGSPVSQTMNFMQKSVI